MTPSNYHTHTTFCHGADHPEELVLEAIRLGCPEIGFSCHAYTSFDDSYCMSRAVTKEYRECITDLKHKYADRIKVLLGIEQDFYSDDTPEGYDFVIGSVHYVGGYDPYLKEYWNGKSVREAFEEYLLKTLDAVRANADFDVLGHISYVCKSPNNLSHVPLHYADFSDICDEIMKTLAHNGKGMEINTSGVDRCGVFLPTIDFIKRYKELGGEIVTVGSDAHVSENVGKYIGGALEIARETFGYVCTFEQRKPIFHKL